MGKTRRVTFLKYIEENWNKERTVIPKTAQVASLWTPKSRSKMITQEGEMVSSELTKFSCPPTSSALSASTWGGCVRVCVCACVCVCRDRHRDRLLWKCTGITSSRLSVVVLYHIKCDCAVRYSQSWAQCQSPSLFSINMAWSTAFLEVGIQNKNKG